MTKRDSPIYLNGAGLSTQQGCQYKGPWSKKFNQVHVLPNVVYWASLHSWRFTLKHELHIFAVHLGIVVAKYKRIAATATFRSCKILSQSILRHCTVSWYLISLKFRDLFPSAHCIVYTLWVWTPAKNRSVFLLHECHRKVISTQLLRLKTPHATVVLWGLQCKEFSVLASWNYYHNKM